MKSIHPFIFQEYGVPKFYLNRYPRKIYPLLKISNLSYLQNRVAVGEISPGKVREIVNLKVRMKKNGRPNESLVITSANIEGGHGLPFVCRSVADQLQNVVKAVK